jgi:hypothetical protein
MHYFYATRYSHGVMMYSADCAAQQEGAMPLIPRWFAAPNDARKAAAASGTLMPVVALWT